MTRTTYTVVWDLELQKAVVPAVPEQRSVAQQELFEADKAVAGWEFAHQAGISCAVAYAIEEDRYFLFDDSRESHLRLRKLLFRASHVVGWNHWRFDYNVLATTLGVNLSSLTDTQAGPGKRDLDLLQMLWGGMGEVQYGECCRLEDVARGTLGAGFGKTGTGADAPLLYQAGQWSQLLEYCLRNVQLTARLYAFWKDHGYLVNGVGHRIALLAPVAWL